MCAIDRTAVSVGSYERCQTERIPNVYRRWQRFQACSSSVWCPLTVVPRHVRVGAGLGARVSEQQARRDAEAGARRGIRAERVQRAAGRISVPLHQLSGVHMVNSGSHCCVAAIHGATPNGLSALVGCKITEQNNQKYQTWLVGRSQSLGVSRANVNRSVRLSKWLTSSSQVRISLRTIGGGVTRPRNTVM